MATIVTRAGKGTALTFTEGDNNFTNLNTELGNKVASVSGTAGRITIGGTSTAPTVDLASGVVSPASVTYASITVDTYGRVTALSSGTAPVTSVSGTAGRITSSGGTTPSLDLASGVISSTGTFAGRVTVDTYGRVTAATNDVTGYTEPIFDLGTTGGTIAPNVANGNVQKITLNSALTINAFTSPVAGQSLTLIIFGGTAYTSITSTMKFAGGVKTLTGTASCIDILSVYYDGTNYYASLNKGFA